MPGTNQGENQDQDGDDQQTRRLKRINLRHVMVFRGSFGLPFWTRRAHGHIVTLEWIGKKTSTRADFSGTRVTVATYHRP